MSFVPPIPPLPISEELCECMVRLCEEHDLALDWECPQNNLLWTGKEQNVFWQKAKQIYQRICEALPEGWEIFDETEKCFDRSE